MTRFKTEGVYLNEKLLFEDNMKMLPGMFSYGIKLFAFIPPWHILESLHIHELITDICL